MYMSHNDLIGKHSTSECYITNGFYTKFYYEIELYVISLYRVYLYIHTDTHFLINQQGNINIKKYYIYMRICAFVYINIKKLHVYENMEVCNVCIV